MFFQRKIDKVLDLKKIEEARNQETDREPLEKGDLPAMFIAAFLMLFPVVLIIIGVVFGIMKFFIR